MPSSEMLRAPIPSSMAAKPDFRPMESSGRFTMPASTATGSCSTMSPGIRWTRDVVEVGTPAHGEGGSHKLTKQTCERQLLVSKQSRRDVQPADKNVHGADVPGLQFQYDLASQKSDIKIFGKCVEVDKVMFASFASIVAKHASTAGNLHLHV